MLILIIKKLTKLIYFKEKISDIKIYFLNTDKIGIKSIEMLKREQIRIILIIQTMNQL